MEKLVNPQEELRKAKLLLESNGYKVINEKAIKMLTVTNDIPLEQLNHDPARARRHLLEYASTTLAKELAPALRYTEGAKLWQDDFARTIAIRADLKFIDARYEDWENPVIQRLTDFPRDM